MPEDFGSPDDLRRLLLAHCLGAPDGRAGSGDGGAPGGAFDSVFERDVWERLTARGYRVVPQFRVGPYRIDLVVEGTQGRLAIECDGDRWHGPERHDHDQARQRMLERCGWRFWRVSGRRFYLDPEAAMAPLWPLLDRLDIAPGAPGERRVT